MNADQWIKYNSPGAPPKPKKRKKYTKKDRPPRAITLYVLRLEDDNWYIGITRDLNKRFEQHKTGKGAKWTRLHKPVSIHETVHLGPVSKKYACSIEDQATLEYAAIYGEAYVRGGSFCKLKPCYPRK